MKALSLWQPWASGIALGYKRIETRHWTTSYRGSIAIHAAKIYAAEQRAFHVDEMRLWRMPRELPFGAVIAIARLVDVVPTEQLIDQVSSIERRYGDFGPGRFGWLLDDIEALAAPVSAIGRQGLFDIPEAQLGLASIVPAQGKLL